MIFKERTCRAFLLRESVMNYIEKKCRKFLARENMRERVKNMNIRLNN